MWSHESYQRVDFEPSLQRFGRRLTEVRKRICLFVLFFPLHTLSLRPLFKQNCLLADMSSLAKKWFRNEWCSSLDPGPAMFVDKAFWCKVCWIVWLKTGRSRGVATSYFLNLWWTAHALKRNKVFLVLRVVLISWTLQYVWEERVKFGYCTWRYFNM